MTGTEDGFDSTSLLSGWVNNNKTPFLNLDYSKIKIKKRDFLCFVMKIVCYFF